MKLEAGMKLKFEQSWKFEQSLMLETVESWIKSQNCIEVGSCKWELSWNLGLS